MTLPNLIIVAVNPLVKKEALLLTEACDAVDDCWRAAVHYARWQHVVLNQSKVVLKSDKILWVMTYSDINNKDILQDILQANTLCCVFVGNHRFPFMRELKKRALGLLGDYPSIFLSFVSMHKRHQKIKIAMVKRLVHYWLHHQNPSKTNSALAKNTLPTNYLVRFDLLAIATALGIDLIALYEKTRIHNPMFDQYPFCLSHIDSIRQKFCRVLSTQPQQLHPSARYGLLLLAHQSRQHGLVQSNQIAEDIARYFVDDDKEQKILSYLSVTLILEIHPQSIENQQGVKKAFVNESLPLLLRVLMLRLLIQCQTSNDSTGHNTDSFKRLMEMAARLPKAQQALINIELFSKINELQNQFLDLWDNKKRANVG